MKKGKLGLALKNILTIISLVVASLLATTSCFAATDAITLTTDKTDLQSGDEITVSADLPADSKLFALTATLQYDQNIFEPIDDQDFDHQDNVNVLYNTENNQFGIINQSGQVEQNLFSIRMRVKDGSNVGDTNIALTNISSSDGSQITEYSPVVAKVSVARDVPDGETVPVGEENIISEETASPQNVFYSTPFIAAAVVVVAIIAAFIIYYRHKVAPDTSKLYYSLAALGLIIVALVIGLAAVNDHKKDVNDDGVIDYSDTEDIISYLIDAKGQSKDNNENQSQSQPNRSSSSSQRTNSQTVATGSSDNSSQSTESTDVNLSSSSSNPPSNNSPSNDPSSSNPSSPNHPSDDPFHQRPDQFDTNNDGNVDVNDAGHNAEEAQKATTASLRASNLQEQYVEKGTTSLFFAADVKPESVKLTKVKISDQKYPVEEDTDGNYLLKIDPLAASGPQNYHITEVETSNGKTLSVNFIINVEVRKDAPSVIGFKHSKNAEKINFHIYDPDEALQSSDVKIYDQSNLDNPELTQATSRGDNEINHDFQPNRSYYIVVTGNYCRVIDTGVTSECSHDSVFHSHSFSMTEDYNFALTDFSVIDYVDPNKKPILNFKSTNALNFAVKSVQLEVDGQEIISPVILSSDGTYQAVIENSDMTPGQKHRVKLTSVTLENAQSFTNHEDFEANEYTYFVPKNVPQVKNLKLSHQSENKSIQAKFNLEDIDATVSHLIVLMTNGAQQTIAKQEIVMDELENRNDITVDLNYEQARDLGFRVEILADYDLGDKYNFDDARLAEDTIEVYDQNDLYIDKISSRSMTGQSPVVTQYAEKGQKKFQLLLNLVRNTSLVGACGVYSNNTAYTVNGNNYPSFNPGGDYNASVFLGIPDRAGVINVEVTRTQFSFTGGYYCKSDDWYSIPKRAYEIEVLKDVPSISNLKTEDDYEAQKVTFTFDVNVDETASDNDESFISGKVKLGNQEQTFDQRGANTVTFENVPRNELNDLTFLATYDRDTDCLNQANDGRDDNTYTDDPIYQSQYVLYNESEFNSVEIADARALTNSKVENDSFFEKNETVGLYFTISGLPAQVNHPVSVTIDDNAVQYDLVQIIDDSNQPIPDHYAVFLPGYQSSGPKSVAISSITLENGKVVKPSGESQFDFEILKDKPTITNYSYLDTSSHFTIRSKLSDPDQSLIDTPTIAVTNELSDNRLEETYSESFEIKNDGSSRYYVTINADYSRTEQKTPNNNRYYRKAAPLFSTMLSSSTNEIMLKNITNLNLYQIDQAGYSRLVDQASKEEINSNKGQYFVEIIMSDMPTLRVDVVGALEIDNNLYLQLNAQHLSVAGEQKVFSPTIEYGPLDKKQVATNKYHRDTEAEERQAFEELLRKLESNQEITLERDYDASSYDAPNTGYYLASFSGKLHGNGHSIKNLKAGLFKDLTGEIDNLFLENVRVDNHGKGAIAQFSKNAKLYQVAVYNLTLKNGSDETGGLIGKTEHTTIESCAATGINIEPGGVQQVGGLVGSFRYNSIIKNSYATGKISGPTGYLGGIVGSSNTPETSTVEYSYAKVELNDASVSCGIGCIYTGRINFLNTISLGTRYNSAITNDITKTEKFSNNFYLTPAGKVFPQEQGTEISSTENINQDLFKRAGFSSNIWRLSKVSSDSLPKLNFEPNPTSVFATETNYREANADIYQNLSKLSPYYGASEIVKVGNLATNEIITTKTIKHIVPIDANGGLVTYLETKDLGKLQKIKVIFEDGSTGTYHAAFDKLYDMVASYRIRELNADYVFPHYVIDSESRTVDNLVYYLKSLNYTSNLDSLTKANDGRVLRDFYNNTTANELKEFVLKYLSNSNFTNTNHNEAANNQIERGAKQDNRIVKALYVYNLLRRFYDVEIDGIKLYDFMLFNMRGFNQSLSTENIINAFFSDETNFDTAHLSTKSYSNIFAPYTNCEDLPTFLQYLVSSLGNGMDTNSWIRSQFKGYLVEISIDSQPDYNSDRGLIPNANAEPKGIQYTLWDHFINRDKKYGRQFADQILPILTLPENSTYIVSSPVQLLIGSQRSYVVDPSNPGQHELLSRRIETYAERIKNYFTTAYGILEDKTLFNNLHLYHLDRRSSYEENGNTVYNIPNSTTDPFAINYNEVLGRWATSDGNAAVAYGDRIEWSAEGVFDGNINPELVDSVGPLQEYTFHTFTHETAHNIDARLFLRDNGRRWDAGGEDYADANLMQDFNKNSIVMNLSVEYGENCEYASNCSPSRIDSQEEIHQFYQNVFDIIYAMDYLEGLAFLQLSPEYMAETAAQISYPRENTSETMSANVAAQFPNGFGDDEKARYRAAELSRIAYIDKEAYQNMQLDTVYDLYKNRLIISPGLYKVSTRGSNLYGGDGLNVVHWYQAHNDYGRPDSYSLKWFAYEMLGYKGYDDGYVEYYSNINPLKESYTYYNNFETKNTSKTMEYKTDLSALKSVAQDNEITFDSYKQKRFEEVESNLKRLNKVINVKEYVKRFYEALIADVEYQRTELPKKFTDEAGEQACLKDYWCTHTYWGGTGLYDIMGKPNSTQVRQEFYQTLKKLTKDFTTGAVYQPTEQQDFEDIDQLRHLIEREYPDIKR